MTATQMISDIPRSALRGKRGLLDIVNLILLVCAEGEIKTHVMQRCNLNSRQTQDYVTLLLKYQLLEKSTDLRNDVYQTTERGKRFLEAYAELSGIFNLIVNVEEAMPPKFLEIPGAPGHDAPTIPSEAASDRSGLTS